MFLKQIAISGVLFQAEIKSIELLPCCAGWRWRRGGGSSGSRRRAGWCRALRRSGARFNTLKKHHVNCFKNSILNLSFPPLRGSVHYGAAGWVKCLFYTFAESSTRGVLKLLSCQSRARGMAEKYQHNIFYNLLPQTVEPKQIKNSGQRNLTRLQANFDHHQTFLFVEIHFLNQNSNFRDVSRVLNYHPALRWHWCPARAGPSCPCRRPSGGCRSPWHTLSERVRRNAGAAPTGAGFNCEKFQGIKSQFWKVGRYSRYCMLWLSP